ncbi:MAG: DsbA family protein [Candidatus Altiarchaeota archaeon]
MADEENTDIGTPSPVVEIKAKTTRKAEAKKRRAPRKTPAKHKVEAAPTHAKAAKDAGAGYAFPLEKALAALLVIAVLAIGYLLLTNLGDDATVSTTTSIPGTTQPARATGDKAKLDFYIMSQCPYGVQVLDAIAPVLKKMGGSIDLTVNYIADDAGDGKFESLHGQTEVDENIRELCAMKYYPQDYKWMDYVVCRDKNIRSTAWESCATGSGMDVAKMTACSTGDEGKQLLKASLEAATSAGARGSPTMFLNGNAYNGGRKEADFIRAICGVLAVKPEACDKIPKPLDFQVTVLSDKLCKSCDTTMFEGRLKTMFPGVQIKNLDYSSPEGKSLYDATQVKLLPAFLFEKKVTQDPGYADVKNYLFEAGNYMSLKIGATWDPYCDATNEHCSEDLCKGRMSCRQEIPKKLDVFVMSQCPYGLQALNSMKEVIATFNDLKFDIHFIGTYNEAKGTFTSLHGQPEVDEDLREICAIKNYPNNFDYMDYIWCRNADMKGDWQKCATDNGMDAAKLKTCAEGEEGKNLLKESFALTEQLSVTGSPTWLANNKYKFQGIAADAIKTNLCLYNQGWAGCEKTLSGSTGGVAATGGC